jgi:uncharacterized membrane protein YccC
MSWDTVIGALITLAAVVVAWILNSVSQDRQRKHDAAQLERTLAENHARERRDAVRDIRRQQADRIEEFLRTVEQYQGHIMKGNLSVRSLERMLQQQFGRTLSDEERAELHVAKLEGRPDPREIIARYTGMLFSIANEDLRNKLTLLHAHVVADRELLKPSEVSGLLIEVREILAEGLVNAPS